MDIKSYNDQKDALNRYTELIESLYPEYPAFREAKIKEINNVFSADNPFLRFGGWKNFLLFDRGLPVAHITASYDSRLGDKIGHIGYFDSVDNKKYARAIIGSAALYLKERGKTLIRGPINLTTWQMFGAAHPEAASPFFMEPFNRGYYTDLLEDSGFKQTMSRRSTISSLDESGLAEYDKDYFRLSESGYTFEEASGGGIADAMPLIHAIILKAFSDTWSFVELTLEEFLYNYSGMTEIMSRALLFFVRDSGGEVIGFLLGMPDFYSTDEVRVVLKTIGILPEHQGFGLGRALFYLAYDWAGKRGGSRLIFSTMRRDNTGPRAMVGMDRSIYREYALYEMRQ